MKQCNVSSLLVQRGSHGDTWGFLTQTDVVEKVVAEGHRSRGDPGPGDHDQAGHHRIPQLQPDGLRSLMARADIRRVLVFDGQDIVGIVSSSDIFDAL